MAKRYKKNITIQAKDKADLKNKIREKAPKVDKSKTKFLNYRREEKILFEYKRNNRNKK